MSARYSLIAEYNAETKRLRVRETGLFKGLFPSIRKESLRKASIAAKENPYTVFVASYNPETEQVEVEEDSDLVSAASS